MRIVLIQSVNNLGKAGDIKEVSDGYARNFLIPKKLAEIATAAALEKVKKISEKKMEEEKENLKKIKKLANAVNEKELIIKTKEKKGRLFGSIGTKEIAELLKKEGIEISEKAIELSGPIKETGEKEIVIKLSQDTRAKIKLIVQGE